MSSYTGTFDLSSPAQGQIIQISNLDEPSIHLNHYQQSVPKKRRSRHHRSRDDQSRQNDQKSIAALATENPLIGIHMSYYGLQEDSNINRNTFSIQTMVMGPDDASRMINILSSKSKLFEKFPVPFQSEDTVADLMQKIFIPRFKKTHWIVHVLYRNNRLREDQMIVDICKEDTSVLYILLIPPNKLEETETSSAESLSFEDPPSFRPSVNVLVRVFQTNTSKTKCGIVRIPVFDMNTQVRDLKQRVWKELKMEEGSCHIQLYYYGYELSDNMRPSISASTSFIARDELPRIFDFVLTENQNTERILPEDGGSKNEIFFANFALIYYVRLRMHAAFASRNNNKSLRKDSKPINIVDDKRDKMKNDGIHEVLKDFYTYCDKDKSSKLDERETKLGLLTLFKYINQESDQNQLTIKSVIPLVYSKENDDDGEVGYCTEQDFQTLVIDTLTEHIRLQACQYPTSSFLKNGNAISKKIDHMSKGIIQMLEGPLQISDESQGKNPFQIAKIIGCILSPLTLICLPIIVCISLYKIMHKGQHPLMSKNHRLGPILLIICFTLLSCIAYLILLNLILYHANYHVNSDWRVNSLEVYWPFALMIYFVLIYYLYFFVTITDNKNEQKREIIEETYNDAEIEMLKDKVKVTTTDGQRMTVAEFESQPNLTDQEKKIIQYENSLINENTISNNLKTFFYKTYVQASQNTKTSSKILKIIGLLIIVATAVLHTCVPVIHRTYFSNRTDPNTIRPFQIPLIEISYFVIGVPMYLIFLLMVVYAFLKYHILHLKITEILQRTANHSRYKGSSTDNNQGYYLNLKKPDNLDLFLALIRKQYQINNNIEYRIAFVSMCGALVFDVILIIVSVIRLVYYGIGGLYTLTSIYALIDMIILSLLIISFLIGIAVINTATTKDVLELLLRTKKEAISETSKRSAEDKNWSVTYLTATNEYLAKNQSKYSMSLLGFTINTPYISGLAITMLGGIASAFVSLVKKSIDGEA